jgi:hypothetical protein
MKSNAEMGRGVDTLVNDSAKLSIGCVFVGLMACSLPMVLEDNLVT